MRGLWCDATPWDHACRFEWRSAVPPAPDLIGKRFHRLTVIQRLPTKRRRAYWRCRCDCGAFTDVPTDALRSGNTKSCGCLKSERTSQRNTTHGMSNTRVYRVWCHMLGRCQNLTDQDYADYGGRGIEVCDRWKSFENFYADMGDPPPGRTLNRIDNEGHYDPDNCEWSTSTEQARNKRNNRIITWNGRTQTLPAWAEETGIPYHTLKARLFVLKWPVEEALTTPVPAFWGM